MGREARTSLFLAKAQRLFNGSGELAVESIVRFVRWKIKTVEAVSHFVSKVFLLFKSNRIGHTKCDSSVEH